MINTNPDFWEQWEQLGQAVAVQAIRDYAKLKRKLAKGVPVQNMNTYDFVSDIRHYERFFRSKYFGRICPEYDGYMLLEMLNAGWWKKIPRVHHSPRKIHGPTYNYQYVQKKDGRGRPRKYGSEWGMY